MKLATFLLDGAMRVGVVDGAVIRVLNEDMDMIDAMYLYMEGIELKAERSVSASAVELLSPIPNPPQDVICLGLNYREHAIESAKFSNKTFVEAEKAVYFSKRVNEAVAPDGDIQGHFDMTRQLDYEAELAFIIGRDAKDVKACDAGEYIFGFTVLNDVSAREIQSERRQWYFGKSLDGFTPMGPYIVTADELGVDPHLAIRSFVNGEIRQDGNTRDLIHTPSEIIEDLSRGMTLLAGTIISTGTPKGVGMGMTPPTFLNKGDVVVCEIEKIGRLENTVV
ncbi:MAG: fumarylacetoacetate hydrolase family protein [Clostridia bacterium]|nr:fumarylacetoacetate hydrolase family protein [Clostridia bacterium]